MGSGSCGCGPREADDFDCDREGVSDADLDRFGDDVIGCPECGADVYHDAPLCQSCGHAMGDPADSQGTGARPWFALGAVAVIVAFVAVYIF